MKNLPAKRPNAAMEQLVLEMAYSQSPINNINKNEKVCEFSIKTYVKHRPIYNHSEDEHCNNVRRTYHEIQ